jgi:hypothetical protein
LLPYCLKRVHLPKNLLWKIMKPPRPLKGRTGMMLRIPWRELNPISRLPRQIPREKRKGEKGSARMI